MFASNPSQQNLRQLYDADVIDETGDKVGGVGQVYLDDVTGNPTWVTVRSGLLGSTETFAPLDGATMVDGNIQVAYRKDFIAEAPGIDAEHSLTPEMEGQLYSYYDIRTVADEAEVADEAQPTDQPAAAANEPR